MLKRLFTRKRREDKFEVALNQLYVLIEEFGSKLNDPTAMEAEIDAVLESIVKVGPEYKEYTIAMENLEKLCKARSDEKTHFEKYVELLEALDKLTKAKATKPAVQFPWEAVVVGGFACLQLLMIMNYEKLDVISTKGFGLVLKGRV